MVGTLTFIYNLCIQKSAFPAIFKRAKVTALLKTEAILSDLNDYCPISILPVLTKTLEKHIHKHLTDFLEAHNLFHSFQSGFRRRHSCLTVLARLTDTWLSAFNNRQISGAVFLDLRKAFDIVIHIFYLKSYQPTIKAPRLLHSYNPIYMVDYS